MSILANVDIERTILNSVIFDNTLFDKVYQIQNNQYTFKVFLK